MMRRRTPLICRTTRQFKPASARTLWLMAHRSTCKQQINYNTMPEVHRHHRVWPSCKLLCMIYPLKVAPQLLESRNQSWMRMSKTHDRENLTKSGHSYFRSIHILLPILPESQASLQSAIDQAAPELRQAFFAAVHVAVRSASQPVPSAEAKSAADQCLAAQRSQSATSSAGDNLLRLQMLLFLTIADELSGPTSARGGTWLGSAVALANSLRLQRPVGPNTNETSRLLRRSWLSLIILDRWHSAATCSATLIHDEDIMMDSSDHALLGSSSYHMLRAQNQPHPPRSQS